MPIRREYWSGGHIPHLDRPELVRVGPVTLGKYGGNSAAGARKNEDGAIVWTRKDWVLAVVLDGHGGSSSVDAVLDTFLDAEDHLLARCDHARPRDLGALQHALVHLLTTGRTAARMEKARGEAACLICYQCAGYLLWISIGDNTLYLAHPELARLSQHTLTTRNFFEWIGERNSLAGSPPCYSSGIRELRQGRNTIVLATDGIEEIPGTPFAPPSAFAAALGRFEHPAGAFEAMLAEAHAAGTVDSCTLIGWTVDNPKPGLMPSA